MYSWIWRRLPGPLVVRAVLALVLAAAVVYGLFEYFFPWLDPRLPFNQVGEVGGETP
jgi:hypothetical protein